jgi:dipeptidyl aminopeptidase/acylaminoacyl peptidase
VGKPDWEKVVTPVVNFASEQPGVDPDRMALLGISMGGYLAPRALAFEHRLKAGVANGGVWSMAKAVEDALRPEQVGWAESDPRKFDEAFQPLMAVPKVKGFDEVV